MPPRGVKKDSKRGRQYEHVKESQLEQGRSEDEAEEIAARVVNKERARHGESTTASKASTDDPLSSGSAADAAPVPIAERGERATSSTRRRGARTCRADRR